MNDKNGKTICQCWKISKYLAVIDNVALRESLITHCITSLAQVNVVMWLTSERGYGQATYLRMVDDL